MCEKGKHALDFGSENRAAHVRTWPTSADALHKVGRLVSWGPSDVSAALEFVQVGGPGSGGLIYVTTRPPPMSPNNDFWPDPADLDSAASRQRTNWVAD
jgi:hypothetical protein